MRGRTVGHAGKGKTDPLPSRLGTCSSEGSEFRQTRAQAANAAARAKEAAERFANEQQVREMFQAEKEKMKEVVFCCFNL